MAKGAETVTVRVTNARSIRRRVWMLGTSARILAALLRLVPGKVRRERLIDRLTARYLRASERLMYSVEAEVV